MADGPKYPNLKYPWQRFILDAFAETHPAEFLKKINAAQRAIAARLCDSTPADIDERIALNDGLQSLHALMQEPQPKRTEHGEKKDTA